MDKMIFNEHQPAYIFQSSIYGLAASHNSSLLKGQLDGPLN